MRIKTKILRVYYAIVLALVPLFGVYSPVSAEPADFFFTFDDVSVAPGQQDVPVYVHLNSNGTDVTFAGCEVDTDATEATFSHGLENNGSFTTDFAGPNGNFDAGGAPNQRLFYGNSTTPVTASSDIEVYVMLYDVTAAATGTLDFSFDTADTANCLVNDGSTAPFSTINGAANSINVSGVTVTESGGSTDVVENGATDTYDVVLDAEPASNVIINVVDDSQVNVDSSSLIFTNANWDTAQTITVTAEDDATVEGAHTGTVTMNVDAGSDPLYTGLTVNSVVANITDNDGGLVAEFTNTAASDNEDTGGNLPQVVVSGADTTGGSTETIDVTVTGGTATGGGDDYNFTDPETISITPGDYTTPTTLSLSSLGIVTDSTLESDETIIFGFTNPSGGVSVGDADGDTTTESAHTYTITNDDGLLVELSTTAASDNENTGGNVPVLVVSGDDTTGGSNSTVNVNLSGTAVGGTDYTSSGTTVTITAGDYTTPVTVPIGLTINGDTTVEADDTIDMSLSAPVNVSIGDADSNSITNTSSTYTITNDDQLTAEFTSITASDAEASGGNVPQILVNGTSEVATTIRVDDQASGSATSGSDYSLTDPVDVAVPAATYDGTTGTALSVPLTITDDQLIESSETIDFDLSSTVSNIALADVDLADGVESSHTYTITDDDTLDVEFDVATDSANEDDGYTPQLRVGGAILGANGSIEVTVTGGTATGGGDDYTFTSPASITIPLGDYSSGTTTIDVTSFSVGADGLIESDETVDFGLQNPSTGVAIGDADGSTVTESALNFTIANDDGLLVEFTSGSASDNEDTGGNLPQVVVSGADTTSGSSESVQVTVTGGTATGSGDDYTFTDPELFTIAPGDYTTPTTFSIASLGIVTDANIESNETIVFGFTGASGGVSIGDANGNSSTDSTHTYTINNDDGLLVEFSDTTGADSEAGGGNVPTITVFGAVAAGTETITVDATGGTATGGGDDYTFTDPTVVTIPAGDYTSTPGSVPIGLTINDNTTVETDETITLSLTSASGLSIGDADSADGIESAHTYTITNDDTLTAEFSTTAASDAEASGGNIPTVFVNGTSDIATSVTVDDNGTGTATNGTDYTFTDPTTVAIPAGTYDGTTATDVTFSFAITDESTVESDETVILDIQATSYVVIGDADSSSVVESTHTYTITNDDTAAADTDNDGITDDIENAGPNGGDANGDGTADANQPSVASLVNAVSGQYNVLEIANGCTTVGSYAIAAEASQTTQDSDFDFPQGLNDFTLTCGSSGETATITIILDQIYDTSAMTVRKLNRTTGTYSAVTATFGTKTVGGTEKTTLSYTATDGGTNDEDAAANATIVDPVGVAVAGASLAETGTNYTGTITVGMAVVGASVILFTMTTRRRQRAYYTLQR